jgi:multiple sugar transport system substrate-binding protein
MTTTTRLGGSVAAAAALALALTGCSGGASGGGDGDTPQLTYMFRGSADEKKAYELAIDQFEQDNDVEVEVIVTDADQYTTKLQAQIAGNQVPDVFYVEQGSVRAFVENGILMDITEGVEASGVDLDNIWQYGVDSYRYDGKVVGEGALYGLPKDVGPFSFGYNKTMFEANGIPLPDPDVPLTWDEWIEICKQLTKDNNGDGALDQWGTGLNVQWNLQAFVWSNGGDWANEDKTEVTVDTPEFAEALQFFADIQNVHGVTPSIAESQTMDTYQRWMRGEIGFFPVGPWDVSTYNDLEFEYDLIPYPVPEEGAEPATWIGSLGIGVSANTEHPELATKLATYLSADEDAQRSLLEQSIQVPNLIDMAETEYAPATDAKPANKQEFLEVVQEYGRALPAARTWSGEWYDEFFVGIQPVIDGKQTAEDYLAEVQPRMQEKLDRANQEAEMASQGG